MSNVAALVREAETVLREAGIPEPGREASLLMQLAVARDRTFVIAHPEYGLTAAESDLFESAVLRRAAHEPYQYIAGRQEFYGLDFLVTPAVLIPRSETEMLVEKAIELVDRHKSGNFLEIGTGSGCISVAILKHCPAVGAVAVDVSAEALEVARRNASLHRVDGSIDLLVSDVYALVPDQRFDMIVSNPPYVPAREVSGLQAEVRDHEPRVALTDGADGLSIVARIVEDAPRFLKPGGSLLIEIGMGQSERVERMFSPEIWASAATEPDLQGIPRMVVARLR